MTVAESGQLERTRYGVHQSQQRKPEDSHLTPVGALPSAAGFVPMNDSVSSRAQHRWVARCSRRESNSHAHEGAPGSEPGASSSSATRARNRNGGRWRSTQARSHDQFTFHARERGERARYGDQDSNLDRRASKARVLPLDHPRVRDPRIELGGATASGWCRHQTTASRSDATRGVEPRPESV